jgi:hypothetical protein
VGAKQKVANFFRAGLIHPLTMSFRRAAVERSIVYIGRIAQKARKGDARALRDLRDLGLDPSDAGLMKYLADEMGMPSAFDLNNNRYGERVMAAINRFSDETVLAPKAVDKPRLASTAENNLMYAIWGFQSAFTENVLKRIYRHAVGAAKDAKGDKGAALATEVAGVGVSLGVYTVAVMAVYLLRIGLFSMKSMDDELEEWEEDPLKFLMLAASRTGFTGNLDPLMNALTGIKYRRDFSNILIGAYGGAAVAPADALSLLLQDDNPGTNAGERRMAKSMWSGFAAPIIAHAVLRYGSFLTPVVLPFSSSARVRDTVADITAGPEKKKAEKSEKGTDRDGQTRQNSRQDDRTGGPVSD